MKRPLWLFLLLSVLGVSLWFNWRALQQSSALAPPSPPENSSPASAPAAKIPDAIDFSGTGFDEKAWTLDTPKPPAPIPNELPTPGLPPAPPPPPDWNPDIPLKIEPSTPGQ